MPSSSLAQLAMCSPVRTQILYALAKTKTEVMHQHIGEPHKMVRLSSLGLPLKPPQTSAHLLPQTKNTAELAFRLKKKRAGKKENREKRKKKNGARGCQPLLAVARLQLNEAGEITLGFLQPPGCGSRKKTRRQPMENWGVPPKKRGKPKSPKKVFEAQKMGNPKVLKRWEAPKRWEAYSPWATGKPQVLFAKPSIWSPAPPCPAAGPPGPGGTRPWCSPGSVGSDGTRAPETDTRPLFFICLTWLPALLCRKTHCKHAAV